MEKGAPGKGFSVYPWKNRPGKKRQLLRSDGRKKSPGLSTGTSSPSMDTPRRGQPPKERNGPHPYIVARTFGKVKGGKSRPPVKARPRRQECRDGCRANRNAVSGAPQPDEAGEARNGPGRSPKPEASRSPQAPSGGGRGGGGGRGEPQRQQGSRAATAARNPRRWSREGAGTKAGRRTG